MKGAWLSHVNHLNFGGHNHIPGTADHLRHCQLSSPVSVINFWQSAAMLITSTVEICIHQLGRVEEMGFTARRSYASAVLEVVLLSVCPSVCHTHALWLIQRTYMRYFYTTWKGNPSGQMWFFVQLCSSWQDFKWLKASRGPSAIAELLVVCIRIPHGTEVGLSLGNIVLDGEPAPPPLKGHSPPIFGEYPLWPNGWMD